MTGVDKGSRMSNSQWTDECAEAHRRADGKTKGQQQAPRQLRAREPGSLLPQRVTAPAATAGRPPRPQDPLGTPAHRKRPLLRDRRADDLCLHARERNTQRLLSVPAPAATVGKPPYPQDSLGTTKWVAGNLLQKWPTMDHLCQGIACSAMPCRKWRLPNQAYAQKADTSRAGVQSYDPKWSSRAAEELALTHSRLSSVKAKTATVGSVSRMSNAHQQVRGQHGAAAVGAAASEAVAQDPFLFPPRYIVLLRLALLLQHLCQMLEAMWKRHLTSCNEVGTFAQGATPPPAAPCRPASAAGALGRWLMDG